MEMKNKLIIISSLILVCIGAIFSTNDFVMMTGNNGELFIPVSSGNEDPFLFRFGLLSFSISLLTSMAHAFKKISFKPVFVTYLVISLLFAIFLALIHLDSSIFVASRAGNHIPLITTAVWVVFLVAIVCTPSNKLNQSGTPQSGAPV